MTDENRADKDKSAIETGPNDRVPPQCGRKGVHGGEFQFI